MALYPSKVLRLGDIGPIIISLEEITCCYLVKCKLVLATGYYYEIYNKTGTLPGFIDIKPETSNLGFYTICPLTYTVV